MSRRTRDQRLEAAGSDSYTPGPSETTVSTHVTMTSTLPPAYRPSETEPFMNPQMREYFRQKLLRWREELLRESNETLNHLQEESLQEADLADRASAETDRSPTAPTAIARRRTNRSASSGWRRARSRP
jgi:DnaK suppressor protein